jgi:hypothetical protein
MQKCCRIKAVSEISTLPFDIFRGCSGSKNIGAKKIANIVANGKSFEMIKEKNSKPLTPVKKNIKEKSERLNKAKAGVEKNPTQREKLNKQRNNTKEKGRSSR